MAFRASGLRRDKIIIVESPTKTGSFSKYVNSILKKHQGSLGFANPKLKALDMKNQQVSVVATIGHFKEVLDIELAWKPTGAEVQTKWKVSDGKENVVKNIHSIVKKAPEGSEFIIATDPDREGELIGIHAFSLLPPGVSYSRMYVHAITEEGIEAALKERQVKFLDHRLGSAADTRHCMDRIFGFLGSRVVNHWHSDLRSIGRVQTPSLILLHERALAIKQAEENKVVTYSVVMRLAESSSPNATAAKPSGKEVPVTFLVEADNKEVKKSKFGAKEEAEKALAGLSIAPGAKAADFELVRVGKKGDAFARRKTNTLPPPEPLTMQTLILEAGKKLGMSSADVSLNAQKLFGLGLITYPRTDSTRISEETVTAKIHPHIAQFHGRENIRPLRGEGSEKKKPKADKKKKAKEAAEGNVEDAHEAIHPTNFSMVAGTSKLSDLVKDSRAEQLYGIIHAATVAAFMIPHERETVTVTFTAGKKATFPVSATRVLKPGWKAVFQSAVQDAKEAKSNAVKAGDDEDGAAADQSASEETSDSLFERLAALTPENVTAEPPLFIVSGIGLRESQSKPPPHYTEGTLIQDLKDNGIGRPSTYPTIVKTLESRGYATTHGTRLTITPHGEALVKLAQTFFPTIVDIGFTRTFEGELDSIAQGKGKTMDSVLSEFNEKFFEMITTSASRLPGPTLAAPKEVKSFAIEARSHRSFSSILSASRNYLMRFVPQNAGKVLVQATGANGRTAEPQSPPASPSAGSTTPHSDSTTANAVGA